MNFSVRSLNSRFEHVRIPMFFFCHRTSMLDVARLKSCPYVSNIDEIVDGSKFWMKKLYEDCNQLVYLLSAMKF